MAAKVEELVESVAFIKGVIGVVVCDAEGTPIRDTFPGVDRSQAIAHAQKAAELVQDAVAIAKLEGSTLDTLRIRTMGIEWLIKVSNEYLLVVVQDADAE